MSREFELEVYRKGREMLFVLRGRLVLQYCQEAKHRLNALFTPQVDQVYLYLGDLQFLDSAGLGVLVGLKMNANKNRTRLSFLSPPSRIEDIFRVSKLDTIFEISGGAEADLIHAALCKEEHCVFSDSRSHSNTDAQSGSEAVRSMLTQLGPDSEVMDESTRQARQLCMDAVEYIRQGDYSRAIDAYRRALQIDPDNLSALNNLGIVYEKRQEWYPQAAETWRRVMELSESRADEKHALRARKHLESLSKLMRVE